MAAKLLPSIYLGDQVATSTIVEDLQNGLLKPTKSIPPKYFYDAVGSDIFEKICATPEYYPTRTETKLLQQNSAAIIASAQPDSLLELGSGASRKTVHLLDAAITQNHAITFLPYDVCEPIILEGAADLIARYNHNQHCEIQPLVGDYNISLSDVPSDQGRRLYIFLGGTIGNFTEQQAIDFLTKVRKQLAKHDYLLLGLDRVKEKPILDAAYNDKQGHTAAFNINMLNVINNEAEANFTTDYFQHVAFFDQEKQQIEMYLEATTDQQVVLKKIDTEIHIQQGERILTEISRKFSAESLKSLLSRAGLVIEQHFESHEYLYSLLLLKSSLS